MTAHITILSDQTGEFQFSLVQPHFNARAGIVNDLARVEVPGLASTRMTR